jgi:hypothetical protein
LSADNRGLPSQNGRHTRQHQPRCSQRAERELVTDPRRSDHVIAIAAHCTPQPVGRWRRELADAGQIPPIEPSQRTQRIRT